MRILIVEDEPLIALYLQELLEEAGFEITAVAGRLEKAMAIIESTVFDAAIVDANLCGVSSGPAAAALAARHVPFIIISGYSMKQQESTFPNALYIQKPCRPELLINALKGIQQQS